jgi:hypothetical protein
MIQPTSIDNFYVSHIKGLIGKMQFVVLLDIINNPGSTQVESARRIKDDQNNQGINGITPRFSELAEKGLIKIGAVRKCRITRREVLTWDPTLGEPVKQEKKLSRIEQLNQRILELEEIIASLKKQLESNLKKPDRRQLEMFK